MKQIVSLIERTHDQFIGTRCIALELRSEIERLLAQVDELVLDFTGVTSATHAFMDELVGGLILQRGPEVARRLIFKGCSEDIKEVIRFVVASRTEDFVESKSVH